MRSVPYKFGWYASGAPDVEDERPYEYPDIWAVQKTTGPDRLVIAPSRNHVSLLRGLSEVMNEPFWLLYVLSVTRDESEPGRYQSPEPLGRHRLSEFLATYTSFLESDARHELWIHSVDTDDLLVYDKHNVIYAYGQLRRFRSILEQSAMIERAEVKIPVPHVHHYNVQFDEENRSLLRYLAWKHFPLQLSDY